MATTFKRVAWVSLGNVLTTELNSLGIAGYSALGTAYDNTAGLYLYFAFLINIPSITVVAPNYLHLYMTPALDGANYDDGASATNPAYHLALPIVSVTTGASAKRAQLGGVAYGLPGFALPAALLKFQLYNGMGVAFAGAGSTGALYGAYDQGV